MSKLKTAKDQRDVERQAAQETMKEFLASSDTSESLQIHLDVLDDVDTLIAEIERITKLASSMERSLENLEKESSNMLREIEQRQEAQPFRWLDDFGYRLARRQLNAKASLRAWRERDK